MLFINYFLLLKILIINSCFQLISTNCPQDVIEFKYKITGACWWNAQSNKFRHSNAAEILKNTFSLSCKLFFKNCYSTNLWNYILRFSLCDPMQPLGTVLMFFIHTIQNRNQHYLPIKSHVQPLKWKLTHQYFIWHQRYVLSYISIWKSCINSLCNALSKKFHKKKEHLHPIHAPKIFFFIEKRI